MGNSRPVELKEHVVSVDGMFVKRKGERARAPSCQVGDAPWSSAEIDVIAELSERGVRQRAQFVDFLHQ